MFTLPPTVRLLVIVWHDAVREPPTLKDWFTLMQQNVAQLELGHTEELDPPPVGQAITTGQLLTPHARVTVDFLGELWMVIGERVANEKMKRNK